MKKKKVSVESISAQTDLRVLGTAFSSRDLLRKFICRTQVMESGESFGSGRPKKTFLKQKGSRKNT